VVRRPGQWGRLAQAPARNLLERRLLDQEAVLAFLNDLAIPFDNNQAERDLRGFKVHQNVSNGFRSDPEAEAFARIRGYLATLRKHGQALLAALETVSSACNSRILQIVTGTPYACGPCSSAASRYAQSSALRVCGRPPRGRSTSPARPSATERSCQTWTR
jgi:hypothetical protein